MLLKGSNHFVPEVEDEQLAQTVYRTSENVFLLDHSPQILTLRDTAHSTLQPFVSCPNFGTNLADAAQRTPPELLRLCRRMCGDGYASPSSLTVLPGYAPRAGSAHLVRVA